MPDPSMPRMSGSGIWYSPVRWYTSMKFRPTALCRMRICPGPGSPTRTSAKCKTSGPPCLSIWMALLLDAPRVASEMCDAHRATKRRPLPSEGVGQTGRDTVTAPDEPAPDSLHRPPAHDRAPAVGRQRRRRPAAARAGPPGHPEFPALADCRADPAAFCRLGAAPRQSLVGAVAPLRRARTGGRGLLQRAAIPGAEDVDPPERDAGRRKRARLHAGVRRDVLRPASVAPPVRRCGT